MIDSYKTITSRSEGLFKDRGSKFIGVLVAFDSDQHLKSIIEALKKEHPTARHFCFAFRIGKDGEQYRTNDDGEPAGSAGKPILNQLQSAEITNALLVVIRYFGGTKLGVSGLIQAYKQAAQEAIATAEIIEMVIQDWFEVTCSYELLGDVNKLFRDFELSIVDKSFEHLCVFKVCGKSVDIIGVLEGFGLLTGVSVKSLGRH